MTTFTPRRINAKASKAGKTYWEVETDQGNATCFDYPIVQILEQSIGKPISMYDLETNEKGFINLRPARSKPVQVPTNQPIVATQPQADNFKEARQAKDVSIYTSYAKDIFLELLKADTKNKALQDMMKEAVEVIKQAKVSFERSEIFKSS